MQKVNDFKIREVEFSGFHLNFRKALIVPARSDVQIGELVRMFEKNNENDLLTGRLLMFKITFIDKEPGMIGIGNEWNVHLEKVDIG